jgi:hypothetical protein
LNFSYFLNPTYLKLPSIHFILWQLHFYLFHIPWLLAYNQKPATTWTTVSSGIIQNMAINVTTRQTHTSLEHQDLYLVSNTNKNMSLARVWQLSLGRKDAPFPGTCI